jgi:hypothetical protein
MNSSTLSSRGRVDAPPRVALAGRLTARSGLTSVEIGQMFALLAQNFRGVERRTFDADLEEKNWVVLVEGADGRLHGFSTLLIYSTQVTLRPLIVVCSGDTIVEPSAWGSSALPRAWIQSVYALRSHYPPGDLYWLLLTSGFRTYRFMSVFYRQFYPRYDEATPQAAQVLLEALGAQRFRGMYDREAGVVRFPQPQVLRPELLAVPEGRRSDPHVGFFMERNPGHAAGDELVCLTSLEPDNLTLAGRRMLRDGSHLPSFSTFSTCEVIARKHMSVVRDFSPGVICLNTLNHFGVESLRSRLT